jgi:hypothetical protein
MLHILPKNVGQTAWHGQKHGVCAEQGEIWLYGAMVKLRLLGSAV